MQRNSWAPIVLCMLCLGWAPGVAQAAEPGPIDPDLPEFTTTDSGLRYRILREGEGELPTADSMVVVHYKGWLNNGDVFHDSYEIDTPRDFLLSVSPAGWREGLQLVREGGMIEIEVPPSLGYGAQGLDDRVPPNASLYYIVELIEIK